MFRMLFSRRMVTPLTRAASLRETAQHGFSKREDLIPGPAGRMYPQINVKQDVKDLQFEDFPDAKTRELKYFEPGETRVTVCQFTAGGCEKNDAARSAVTWDGKNLKIERGQLTKGATYQVELTAMGKKKGFEDLKAYYIATTTEARDIVRKGSFESVKGAGRPGRTPNMQQFLYTLADKLFQAEVPLQRICLYMLAI